MRAGNKKTLLFFFCSQLLSAAMVTVERWEFSHHGCEHYGVLEGVVGAKRLNLVLWAWPGHGYLIMVHHSKKQGTRKKVFEFICWGEFTLVLSDSVLQVLWKHWRSLRDIYWGDDNPGTHHQGLKEGAWLDISAGGLCCSDAHQSQRDGTWFTAVRNGDLPSGAIG